jgi:hypothetical protein
MSISVTPQKDVGRHAEPALIAFEPLWSFRCRQAEAE